jgi:hypothetical protein
VAAKPRRAERSRPGSAPAPAATVAATTPLILSEGWQAFGALSAEAPSAGAAHTVEDQYTIPSGYGDHHIVLMVRDPFWLFAYWEIQPEIERGIRGQLLPEEIPGLQTVLRVQDVTNLDFPAQPAHRAFDISLSGLARNWHIHTEAPGRSFIVDIGLLTAAGRFLLLARSNRVTTPRNAPSDITDESWFTADADYWKLFAASGIGPGASPADWSRLVSRQLSSSAAATRGFLGQLKSSQLKGFWCRVDADLVLHGATEPRARVVIQGQPVAVRKDGTFSVRLALPAGQQTVTIDMTSPNGRHTRTVSSIVSLAWQGTPESHLDAADLPHATPETAG